MKRARKSRPESLQTRLAILDAAARTISREGFHGMSMRALASQTGQALSTFYNHFSSKEEVLFQIQRSAFEKLIGSAEEALRGVASPRERLFAFILQHVEYVAANTEVMRVLIHEASTLPKAEREQVRRLKDRYYGLGRAIVEEVHRGGRGARLQSRELEHLTYGVFGMLNWLYGWYQPARHGPPHEVARSLHRLALSGLAAEDPGRIGLDGSELEKKPLRIGGRML